MLWGTPPWKRGASAPGEAKPAPADVEDLVLTPEEIANGWTIATLAAYRKERDEAARLTIFERPRHRLPTRAVRYNPLRGLRRT